MEGGWVVEQVTPPKALRPKARSVYHRLSTSGVLVRVGTIERKGRHFRLHLEDGRSFLVDSDHLLYLAPKGEQLPLCCNPGLNSWQAPPSGGPHVDGLRALLGFLHLEADRLALREGPHARRQ